MTVGVQKEVKRRQTIPAVPLVGDNVPAVPEALSRNEHKQVAKSGQTGLISDDFRKTKFYKERL